MLCSLPSAEPAARRTLELFGAEVELTLLPERARRRRPPPAVLHADRADAILAQEGLWWSEDPPAGLTPNLYPFARAAGLLWSGRPEREIGAELLDLALRLAEPHGGTVLANTLGAAATQPRAHLHLVGERRDFLEALPAVPHRLDGLPREIGAAVEIVRLAAPFPGLVLGIRGERADRARAAASILALRAAPAANAISDGRTTWVALRRCETPAPAFPHPLGCAEIWGRFCYEDEAAFAAADADGLVEALATALLPVA